MGAPKFSKKKYETPSHPWQEDRIKEENELIKKYGLKNKREIWKAKTKLSNYRGQARELLAKVRTGDAQSKKESEQLLIHLNRMSILPANSNLDDILALNIESLLSRRLQTLIYLKGLANTPFQARQLISHGHIAIGERRVTVPGYMVARDQENLINYTTDSALNDAMHPARPKAEFKGIATTIKKEVKPKDEIKETPLEQAPIQPIVNTQPKVEPVAPIPKAEEPKPVKSATEEKPKEVKKQKKEEKVEKNKEGEI